jgi:polyhydroxybutyrate depolymerase
MKPFLPILFCISLAIQTSGQRFDLKFMFDGYQRECIIVKPATPPPPGGYPVVFMLHGTSGDGEKFYNISGWKELGEQENFITVFPSSLTWCFIEDGIEKHNTRWVNGNVTDFPCSGPPQDYVDDIKFLKKLASLIVDTFPVNSSKIFASGFSNGCSMIHKIAIDAGDVFKAVAGCSSPLTMGDSAVPVKRIPVWFMVGTLDDRFIVPPYTELPFGEDSILGYLQVSLNRALVCQGLSQTFDKKIGALTHTYLFNDPQPGVNSQPYLFTLIKDMTHMYPNGTNFPLDAPRLFWEFFNQSVTVATNSTSKKNQTLEVFPNPADSKIQVRITDMDDVIPYTLRVVNSYGKTVYQTSNNTGSHLIIDKKQTGAGLFLLQIQNGNSLLTSKFIFE